MIRKAQLRKIVIGAQHMSDPRVFDS